MHRSSNHPARAWLAPLLGVLAFAAFPAAASAATPATPCTAVPASSPCYTVAPTMVPPPPPTPQDEVVSPQVGRTIIANKGTWTGASTYKYQWLDCTTAAEAVCTPAAPPSINTTYKIAQSDVGSFLALQVTATGAGGSTSANSVSSTNAVKNGTPLNRLAPTLSGATLDGQLLTLTSGTWDGTNTPPDPITYVYQLRRCDGAGLNCSKAFSGPPGPASDGLSAGYTLQDADLGHIMVGYVTAKNNEGSTSVHSHTSTTVVTPANTAVPTISGSAQAGEKLTESHGSWIPKSPTGYTYQWQDCDASGANCSSIAGATSQSYTPINADVGHTLRVLESATSSGVTSSPASSGATGVVKAGSSNGGSNGGSGGSNGGSGGSNGSGNLSSSKIRGLLLKALAVHGKAGTIRGVLNHSGYTFAFSAPSSGRLVVTWYSAPKHGKKILVATVTLVFHTTRPVKAKVVLTKQGRRLLSGTRRAKLTARGAFTPAGRGKISASKEITLRA